MPGSPAQRAGLKSGDIIRSFNGCQGRNDATFAMRDEANPLAMHIGMRFQPLYGRQHIGHEIVMCRVTEFTARLANSTFIEPQHRNFLSRQVISEHREWTMPQNRLIAVMRTRSGD